MTGVVAKVEIDNLQDLEYAIASSPVEPTLVGTRRPEGQIFAADLDTSLVSFASMNADYSVRGVLSETDLTIGMILESDNTRVWSNEMPAGTLAIIPAQAAHTAMHLGGLKYVLMTFDKNTLNELADFEGIDYDEKVLERHQFCHVSPEWAKYSTNYAKGVCRSIADVELLLDGANSTTARAIKQDLVDDLGRIFLHGLVLSDTARFELTPRCLQARRLIHEIQDYVVNTGQSPPTLEGVAKNVGVSRRTIFRAFKSQLGMPPYAYLRLFRLSRVFTVLVSSTKAETTVSSVATSWGFGDLGRFAQQYRRLFGEYPSETLAKPAK